MFLSEFISDFRLLKNIFIYSNLIEEIYLWKVQFDLYEAKNKKAVCFIFFLLIILMLKRRGLKFFLVFQKIILKGTIQV